MQSLHVNGYDMPYLDVGEAGRGPPLVCVHGSLNDFRVWGSVLGPLSERHRLICVSLRHFFPEQWDGAGDTYSIAQHVDDVIAFIEKLNLGPVDLMGHSRGGHVSFRVAQRRPDLLRRLTAITRCFFDSGPSTEYQVRKSPSVPCTQTSGRPSPTSR